MRCEDPDATARPHEDDMSAAAFRALDRRPAAHARTMGEIEELTS